ncbi:hypothetical protein F4810DRAFT_710371 [Camillea tinctor]|nr:hypothetical protein F4810DRAFT_710371 [Camillea tinctor]
MFIHTRTATTHVQLNPKMIQHQLIRRLLTFGAALTIAAGSPVSPPTLTPDPDPSSCSTPDPAQTTGYPDYNQFCQCRPYAAESPPRGNPYLGLVRCETVCAPADPAQRRVRPENESLAACVNACTGSYERRADKRQEGGGEYWFCHGVNFVKGELCEFIGSRGGMEFREGGSDCWYLDGLDS